MKEESARRQQASDGRSHNAARRSIARKALGLWPLCLPLIVLLPGLASFPYPNAQASYSDLAVTHYPNAIFLRRSLIEYHSLPLWSPDILSGCPFAANPLSGIWYPPGWLAFLLPLPLGFNLVVLMHLFWGGAGMYKLACSHGLSYRAALLGALGFVAMPKLFAHYGAGHLTLLYAVPWTPWLLWAARRKGGPIKGRAEWLDAVILALIFLADPRWLFYAGLLWWGWVLFALDFKRGNRRLVFTFQKIKNLLGRTLLAALLAAPLALPMLEFTRLSSRASMTAEDVFAYSLPWGRLLGLFFPDFGGFHEWMFYPGVFILILGTLAILWSFSRPWVRFWTLVLGISLAFSLGSNLPLWLALSELPLFNLMRVPSRALFLSGISLVALAAFAVEDMLSSPLPGGERRARIVLTALSAFILVFFGMVFLLSDGFPFGFAWGAGFALVGAVWIGLRLGGRMVATTWFVGLVVLCLLDLGVVDASLFAPHSAQKVLTEGQPLANYLRQQPDLFRVYSPSYSMPQQTAALIGLELADGVNPMQLQSYVEYMQVASGVPVSGYSVTLPPFEQGDPTSDNAVFQPNTWLLGLLNVRYIIAQYDLAADGMEFMSNYVDTRLYYNKNALPRAWVQPASAPLGAGTSPISSLSWAPNRIEINAKGPGLLVLSELAYPGWQVQVDGQPSEMLKPAGLLRGVNLEPGQHQVVFIFRPISVYLGLLLWALACAYILSRLVRFGRDIRRSTGDYHA